MSEVSTVGSNLKRILQDRHLTHEALADLIRKNSSSTLTIRTISRIVTGEVKDPQALTVNILARALELDASVLYGGSAPQENLDEELSDALDGMAIDPPAPAPLIPAPPANITIKLHEVTMSAGFEVCMKADHLLLVRGALDTEERQDEAARAFQSFVDARRDWRAQNFVEQRETLKCLLATRPFNCKALVGFAQIPYAYKHGRGTLAVLKVNAALEEDAFQLNSRYEIPEEPEYEVIDDAAWADYIPF